MMNLLLMRMMVNIKLLQFEIIDDPAGQVDKLVTLLIKVAEDNYTIAMLIPVHQSDVWEVSEISDVYRVEFYCIEGSS